MYNKTRNLSLLTLWTVPARQGPRPGQAFPYRYSVMTPIPVLAIPESFVEVTDFLQPPSFSQI